MKPAVIIETLLAKLGTPGGRHLYGVLGGYRALDAFAQELQQATGPDGKRLPGPTNVNLGILDAIPDKEFKRLVEDEAKRPEPTAAHVAKAFDRFLRTHLTGGGLAVFSNLELLFAYGIDLNLLRVLAADEDRVLLLLPGRRSAGTIIMFHEAEEGRYKLPTNLIASDHLWELDSPGR